MLTATISGILLMIFGAFIHTAIAKAIIMVGAWLTKNGLMVLFLQSPWGKKTARFFKWIAYMKLGKFVGKVIYRSATWVFRQVDKIKARIYSLSKSWRMK